MNFRVGRDDHPMYPVKVGVAGGGVWMNFRLSEAQAKMLADKLDQSANNEPVESESTWDDQPRWSAQEEGRGNRR